MSKSYIKFLSPSIHNIINISRKKISCPSPRFFNDPIDCFVIQNSDALENIRDDNVRKMLKRIRICSLSKRDKSLLPSDRLSINERLMWAHYTDSHRGLAIEFKFSSYERSLPDELEDFSDDKIVLADVNYAPQLIDNLDILVNQIDQSNWRNVLEETVLDKDDAFKYEDEARIIILSSEKEDFSYIDMPTPEKVIFGKNCDKNFQESLLSIFDKIFNDKIVFCKINSNMKEEPL